MGYDPEYFIIGTTTSTNTNSNNNGIIDESLICVICHTVYHTPMILDPCGHSFCKDCVTELLDSGHENCPVCRTQMLKDEGSGGVSGRFGGGIPPNRALTSFINNMTIRCMNNDISIIKHQQSSDNNNNNSDNATTCCSWTGKLSNFIDHVEKGNCPLQILQCSIVGCTWEGYRHEHTLHNNDNVEYHTTVIMETKLQEMVQTQLQIQLEQKDHEIDTLKARLLDNLENNVSDKLDTWLSNFFRDWIIEKQPYGRYKYFEDFVVYRPMKYLTGTPNTNNIYHLIVGIPGPSGSDWYGGLYPLLITFSNNDRKKVPPTCQFPTTFFHPNVDEDGCVHVNTLLAEHNEFGFRSEGSWDPSISLPELFFCIQQLLVHPNHREVYDPIEYQRIVLEQSEKYQFNIGVNGNNADHTNNSRKFLELAMMELQSSIYPEYSKRLEWENLELVRWKGQRSFQQRVVVDQGSGQQQQQQQQGVVGNVVSSGGRISVTTPQPPRPSLVDNDNSDTIDLDNYDDDDDDDDVQLIMTTNSNTSSIPDDEVENGNRIGDIGIGTDVRGVLNNNNTTTGGSSSSISSSNTNSINDLISRARRTTRSLSSSVAVAVATNSNSNSSNAIPTTTALRDNNGNICECSCCIIGSRCFLDPSSKMRYIFGEGG